MCTLKVIAFDFIDVQIGEYLSGGHLQENFSVVHDDALLNEALHVLNDVAGNKNGFAPRENVLLQVVNEETAVARVKAEGEVVKYEQVCVLRQDESKNHLGTLSAAHGADALPRCYLQTGGEFVVNRRVPFGIERCEVTFGLVDCQEGILNVPLEQQRDALLNVRGQRL